MRNEILKVKIENIDEMRNWLIDRIATEEPYEHGPLPAGGGFSGCFNQIS
jgi:hypothetical protein